MIVPDDVMHQLAERRPVFHSEADFQHAFALEIARADPLAAVRLEYRPWPDERVYLDVWARADGGTFAAELKYMTRALQFDVDGERFVLANHGAQDVRRYDFWLDVVRLERLAAAHPGLDAYAICLTNDPGYWQPPRGTTSVDAAFRLHEGREVTGRLAWTEAASAGTTRGRQVGLAIAGRYPLRWRDFAGVAGQRFRYLAVRIQRAAPANPIQNNAAIDAQDDPAVM